MFYALFLMVSLKNSACYTFSRSQAIGWDMKQVAIVGANADTEEKE